ncbi:unnamed protein product, partial [Rotaria magnacalcarata]
MTHVNFALTQFNTANFSLAEINDANFSSAGFNNTSFASTSFSNTIFANATFKDVNFSLTKFNYAVLSDCNFWHSNLKDAVFQAATLNQVNFSRANLHKTNFIGANMTKSELDNTLSIQDTVLPNGTHVHDENLINNGQADCNIFHISGWTVSNGNITSAISNSSNSNCQFILQSLSTGATMYQRVRLSDTWNSNLWTFSEAVLSAKMSVGVSMELKGIKNDHSVSSKETL